MHVVIKKSGEPRRVVDLRAVNAATQRQTHATEPPFRQATSVPPNTWRFSSDAWNGYHSIPLDPWDTHVTTFLTPWGRLRYLVAPQGSISSGDGYTYWYDLLIRNIKNIKKLVDDVLGWAKTLYKLFVIIMNFLYHTNSHGVTQNPAKFAWGRREIEYLGFWLTEVGIKPSEETLQAITDFPRPTDITGIRSWFGLIEQVAFAFSKNALMEPFRKLLSKNAVCAWDDHLQKSFETAKKEIVALVSSGVKSFNINSPTCIVTDWSKTGVGFALWQETCSCTKLHPSCCKDSWKLITCGSRFCTAAESRYHPIEGELLALAWGLQKTAYYTLGCENLIALVDHKPLLGLLTTRNLGDIENPRLLHLAEKLIRWKFNLQHVAGAKNHTPDALSQYPVSPSGSVCALNNVFPDIHEESDRIEAQVLATSAIRRVLVISWKSLKDAAISDEEHSSLLHHVQSGKHSWPEKLKDFQKVTEHLSTVDGVVMYKGRVVVPTILRPAVIKNLHLSHRGTSGMMLRTLESVWWPGITGDLEQVRSSCLACTKNAPSQAPMPPVQPPTPDFPFQLISADYFNIEGHNYLVIVDRYSD